MDTLAEGPGARSIALHLCGKTPMLWRAAEVKACREAGFVGSMVGSLPRQPRQNIRLGRPMQLMYEEARLLLDTGRGYLSRPCDTHISEEEHCNLVEKHLDEQEHSYREQRSLALEDKRAVLQRIIEEKSNEGNSQTDTAVRSRLSSLEENFDFPRSAMAVQLHTARLGLSHHPEERSFLAAHLLHADKSELRFCVFRDLRRQGFYLTSAGKFGGDFLVYPGDPLCFHAHFIAVCLSMDTQMPLCDLLALSRLGANVKKTVLLCSPCTGGTGDDEVVYTSLQWSGMV